METNFLFALPLVLLYSIAKTSCEQCDTNAILPDIRDELASQCKPTSKKIMTNVDFTLNSRTILPTNSTYTRNNLSPDSEECAAHRSAVARINAESYLQGTPINYDSDNIDYACESVCQFGYEDLMPQYDNADDLCLNEMIMQIPAQDRDTFLNSAQSSTPVPSNYLAYMSFETCNNYMLYRMQLDETDNCVRKCLCEQEVEPVDFVYEDLAFLFRPTCPRAATDIQFDFSQDVPAMSSITIETYDPFGNTRDGLCEDSHDSTTKAFIYHKQVVGTPKEVIDIGIEGCDEEITIEKLPSICDVHALISFTDEAIAGGLTLETDTFLNIVYFYTLDESGKEAACLDFQDKKESYYALFAEGEARNEAIATCNQVCVGIVDEEVECDTNDILPDIRDELASQCKPTCKKIMTDVEFSDDRQTITPINSTYTVDNLSPDSEECVAHRSAVARINANAHLQGTPINYDSDNIDYAGESVCQFGYEDLMPQYGDADDLCLNDMIMQIPAQDRDTFLNSVQSSTPVPSNYLAYMSFETCNNYMLYRMQLDETDNCVRKCLCEQEVEPVDFVYEDLAFLFRPTCPRAATDIQFDFSQDVPAMSSITIETYDPFGDTRDGLCEDSHDTASKAFIFHKQVVGTPTEVIDIGIEGCDEEITIEKLPSICDVHALISFTDEAIAGGLTLETGIMQNLVYFYTLDESGKEAACLDFQDKKESYYALFAEGEARNEAIATCNQVCVGIVDEEVECDTNDILPDIRDELASQCKPTCKKIMTDVEFSDDRQTITPINSTYTVDNLSPDSEECVAHRSAVAKINANAHLQGNPINYDSDNIDYAGESVCQFGYEDLMPQYGDADVLCLNDMIMQIPAQDRDTFLNSVQSSTPVPSNYLAYMSFETCNNYMLYRMQLDETDNCVRKCLCEQEVEPVDFVYEDLAFLFRPTCPRAATDIQFDFSQDVPAMSSITIETYDPFGDTRDGLCEDSHDTASKAFIFHKQVVGTPTEVINLEIEGCQNEGLNLEDLPYICNTYALISFTDEAIAGGLTLETGIMQNLVYFYVLDESGKEAACIDFQDKKESYYALFAEGEARNEAIAACDQVCVGIVDEGGDNTGDGGPKKLSSFVAIGLPLIFSLIFAIFCIGFGCFFALKKSERTERTIRAFDQAQEK
ncbi:MAG: hypothetical protein MHMPM18_001827 [Marteilia pararefringens]